MVRFKYLGKDTCLGFDATATWLCLGYKDSSLGLVWKHLDFGLRTKVTWLGLVYKDSWLGLG